MAPEDVVADFVAAVERGDIEGALDHMATDCEYDNVPIGKAIGHAAIRQVLEMFVSPDEPVQFEIVRQVAQGALVFNERIDHLKIGGRQIDLPVAGVWEVEPASGLITLWRDYFDMGQLNAQMA